MNILIELLAPVGSKEALNAALEGGADAVYLAGKMFGARAYAPNFDDEQLVEAIRNAHLRGVYVYVAVNTLVDNSEMRQLIDYLEFLYEAGADGIIVQDIGVAYVARKVVPGLPIHASTQMTVHNLEGVQFLHSIGFSRIVLAREVSLEDIKYICSNTEAEIEVFIHGALCISYSGQCLMSGMIGGRSGNRGRCAQPCRLPYTLVDSNGMDALENKDAGEYLLSPKDLNTIDLIPELIEAGVKSFKIEGRMKRPEYVATVVDIYRRSIDGHLAYQDQFKIDDQERKDLAQIFNRDFTTAYLKHRPGRTMMSDRRPNNRGVRIGRVMSYNADKRLATIKLDEALNINDIVEFWVKVGGRVSATISNMKVYDQEVSTAPAGTSVTIPVQSPVRVNDRVFKVFDSRLMERARAFFAGSSAVRRIPVDIQVEVSEGMPLNIEIRDSEGFYGQAQSSFLAEKALKRPLNYETISKQIERLGTTIFELGNLNCVVQGEVMVPISEINDTRRRAIEALENARLAKFSREGLVKKSFDHRLSEQIFGKSKNKTVSNESLTELVVNVDNIQKVEKALTSGADIIMFGGENFSHQPITAEDYRKAVELVRKYNRKIILSTPRLVKEWQTNILKVELELFNELKPDAVSIGNLGTLHLANKMINLPIHGDYQLNIYNNATIQFLAQQSVDSVTLSPELNFSQIEDIINRSVLGTECIVHGYLTLMISEYCTLGSYLGDLHTGKCSNACVNHKFWLKDRKNEQFPIVTDQFCRMHVLNAKELSLLPHVPRLTKLGVARIRIEGKYSSVETIGRITKLYSELITKGEKHPLFEQDRINMLEHENITRGHYFRGVL
ncbi:DUF3656 domain-containing U32 family peptidase [Dendrosporobacter sp. 1207_IL3150]|uniref:DUF3656 domain-containing U32 family peptidase n=1 Tax=Dendrosporobacter sp. 1207_IL3150 TaxID=3084054 RepID=UPI002FD95E71